MHFARHGRAGSVIRRADAVAAALALDRAVLVNHHRPGTGRVRWVINARKRHQGAECVLTETLLDCEVAFRGPTKELERAARFAGSLHPRNTVFPFRHVGKVTTGHDVASLDALF